MTIWIWIWIFVYLPFHAERGHNAENDFSMKIKSNCRFFQRSFSEHKLFSMDIHSTYNPLARVTPYLLTLIMLCALMSGGTYSWKSSPNYRFLRNFSWKFTFTVRVFAGNLLRGVAEKLFFHILVYVMLMFILYHYVYIISHPMSQHTTRLWRLPS